MGGLADPAALGAPADVLPPSPACPAEKDWSTHYPAYFPIPSGSTPKRVEFADIGCGFGGLLMDLSPMFPDTLMLGKPQANDASRLVARVCWLIPCVRPPIRHGDPCPGHGLRSRQDRCPAAHPPGQVPERLGHPGKRDEVPHQLLREGPGWSSVLVCAMSCTDFLVLRAVDEALLPLPGSAL